MLTLVPSAGAVGTHSVIGDFCASARAGRTRIYKMWGDGEGALWTVLRAVSGRLLPKQGSKVSSSGAGGQCGASDQTWEPPKTKQVPEPHGPLPQPTN